MNIFNFILDLLIWIVGIITCAKYITLWIIKGCIKFKFIHSGYQVKIKEYVFKK